jgi:hypothetical protein
MSKVFDLICEKRLACKSKKSGLKKNLVAFFLLQNSVPLGSTKKSQLCDYTFLLRWIVGFAA